MILNIVAGVIVAERKGAFDWETFKNGLWKALLYSRNDWPLAAAIDTTLQFDGAPILAYIITANQGIIHLLLRPIFD